MNFNFPNSISVITDGIRGINYDQPNLNLITINKTDYIFKKLTKDGNKGGNSVILKLYSNVIIDTLEDYQNLDNILPDKILKILKFDFKIGREKNNYKKIHKRFLNEIQALTECKNSNTSNVIEIFENGQCRANGLNFLYYTMEMAECDLKEYIEIKHGVLTFEDKIKLCKEILEGIKEIDQNKFYHRDIKPDNIFIVDGKWKIADLGLVSGQTLDYQLFEKSDFIGPRGWISPEVMNKYLTENKNFKRKFDCEIDSKSDLFQLGKLFWYIFQFNVPIGNVKLSDFDRKYQDVYPILKNMLNHNKQKRNDIEDIIVCFKRLERKLLLG